MMWLETSSDGRNHKFKFYQSNHEGNLIDAIHDERQWANGMIINLVHYPTILMQFVMLFLHRYPTVEVHLSHIMDREDFRKISVIKDVCISQVFGLGKKSYLEGLKILNEIN